MSFLDNTTLVVDAVLTSVGRQRLSENNFEIIQFAPSDDGVDYALYNEANTNGPNDYGKVIENMPIHQAFNSDIGFIQRHFLVDTLSPANPPEIANPAGIEGDTINTGGTG